MSFTKRALVMGTGLLAIAGSISTTNAADITFENPPYVAGPLVGQDGWVLNNYINAGFGLFTNGTTRAARPTAAWTMTVLF